MSEGLLTHFGMVRMRATGSGVLRSTLYSLDSIRSSTLPTIIMAATTNREPTILANFIEQKGQLQLQTTTIDETFEISKIVIFVKSIATEYPR